MQATEIDTTATRDIAASPGRLLMLALGSLAFVVGGWYMIEATSGTTRYSREMIALVGYASMAFFGFCLAIAIQRLLTQRGTVITISPDGLRDVRVSPDLIPWAAIQSLSTWQMQGQQVMVVAMKPGEEEKLTLTRIARMSRGANARLGADGLAVTAQGTKIGHDELMATTIAYAQRYGQK